MRRVSNTSNIKNVYYEETSLSMDLSARSPRMPYDNTVPAMDDNGSTDSSRDEENKYVPPSNQNKKDKETPKCYCLLCGALYAGPSVSRATEATAEVESESSSEYWREFSKQLEANERYLFYRVPNKDHLQRNYR